MGNRRIAQFHLYGHTLAPASIVGSRGFSERVNAIDRDENILTSATLWLEIYSVTRVILICLHVMVYPIVSKG
jgi:hypothetical protein